MGKRILGLFLISLPFIAIITVALYILGFKILLFIAVTVVLIMFCLYYGAKFITEG